MVTQTIDGRCFARMLCGGAAMLSAHIQEINDLNVFPVPDGDTGTNMALTLEGGLSEIKAQETDNIGTLSKHFTHGLLLGARGNSGVILSQIFAGIDEELSKHETVGAAELACAYRNGIKKSYASVQNPTEGTIITVFRESTEYAAKNIDDGSSVEDFLKLHITEARRSLAATKEILPALAEADVVDSGGAGYLYIAQGMYEALTGKVQPDLSHVTAKQEKPNLNIDLFTRDSKLEFGYCTEFMLRLTTDKVDPDTFDIEQILSILREMHGESIVAYKTEDIVKVHVHTFTPGDILARAQAFGEFLTVKIENMSLGHSGETAKPKNAVKKKFSVLSVATGDGLCALFRDMGADEIVAGGQTSNPSAEEFIQAFDRCNAEHLIVLPNNKNVFLAAKQAAELYQTAKVHIIPTKSLMQGYGALSVITPAITDIETLVKNSERAANGVIGSEITCAVRDVTIGGKEIFAGDYIAITDGEITAVEKTAEDALCKMLAGVDMDDYEIITLFTGKNVSEDARAALTERIEDLYPDCEVVVFEGGQDVYDYMVAIE